MTPIGALLVGTLATAGVVGYAALRRAGRPKLRAALGALLGVGFLFGAWVMMATMGSPVIGDANSAATGAALVMPFLLAGIIWLLLREG